MSQKRRTEGAGTSIIRDYIHPNVWQSPFHSNDGVLSFNTSAENGQVVHSFNINLLLSYQEHIGMLQPHIFAEANSVSAFGSADLSVMRAAKSMLLAATQGLHPCR